MKYEHIELKADAEGNSVVYLNGTPLKGVKSASVNVSLFEPTEVTITLVANVNCDQ